MTAPPPPPRRPTPAPAADLVAGRSLREDCGLGAPRPALWRWPPDAQLLAALAAAVPVWVALGLFASEALRAPASPWAWLSMLLVQPMLEELVFRGLLQGQLLRLTSGRRWGPASVANWATTAAFVALHLPAQPWAWALAVAAPSLVFGHLRERHGSVWPPMALHAYYNAGFALTAWVVQA